MSVVETIQFRFTVASLPRPPPNLPPATPAPLLGSPASASSVPDINEVVPAKVITLGNRTQADTGEGGPGPAGYLSGQNLTLAVDLINLRGGFKFVFFSGPVLAEPHFKFI